MHTFLQLMAISNSTDPLPWPHILSIVYDYRMLATNKIQLLYNIQVLCVCVSGFDIEAVSSKYHTETNQKYTV